MSIDGVSTVRSRFALPQPAMDGVPAVPPPLSCLSLVFAHGSSDLTRSHDRDAPSPATLLDYYLALFRALDAAFVDAGRALDGPSRLLAHGYYRLEVLAIAHTRTALVDRRAGAVAAALTALSPDVFLPELAAAAEDDRAARRIDVRLVEAMIV